MDLLDPDKAVQFSNTPSTTAQEMLQAFNGPLPPNHYVSIEKAKGAILHLQAGNTNHGEPFTIALAN
ncbi:MAG: hypothetical protein DRP42_05205, partial [Tenericutes bacterium]